MPFCRHADVNVPAVGHVPDNLFIAEPDEEDVFFLVVSDVYGLLPRPLPPDFTPPLKARAEICPQEYREQ